MMSHSEKFCSNYPTPHCHKNSVLSPHTSLKSCLCITRQNTETCSHITHNVLKRTAQELDKCFSEGHRIHLSKKKLRTHRH